MYLEVLEAGEALVAGGAAVRLLVGVGANVDEHLVPAATHVISDRVKCGSQDVTAWSVLSNAERAIVSPGVEAPPLPGAALPVAAVPRILFRLDVEVVDVIHQVLQAVEE